MYNAILFTLAWLQGRQFLPFIWKEFYMYNMAVFVSPEVTVWLTESNYWLTKHTWWVSPAELTGECGSIVPICLVFPGLYTTGFSLLNQLGSVVPLYQSILFCRSTYNWFSSNEPAWQCGERDTWHWDCSGQHGQGWKRRGQILVIAGSEWFPCGF